jgi:amino acid transporter
LARIFSVLALLAVVLLAANFVVGLWIGDFNTPAREYRTAFRHFEDVRRSRSASAEEIERAKAAVAGAEARVATPRSRRTLHFYLGVASSLLAMLVSSIAVTYFVGTSRWCREVVETYKLPMELAERSARLKRRTFPWAVLAMLVIVVIAALGGLSDPSTPVSQKHPDWPAAMVTWHYLAAIVGLLVIASSFWIQLGRIAESYQVIDDILREVQRVRTERGLPTEEPISA